jgi:hypothetical protein
MTTWAPHRLDGTDPHSDRWVGAPSRELLLMVAACLLPLAGFTLAWGPSWLLDFLHQDNWSYVKYFMDWTTSDPVLRAWMSADYKGARVAWIIPGFLAYHLFGPLAGSVVLHLAVTISTILATLAVTARLFGWPAGALATIVFSAHGGFYATGLAGFWSYHGGICALFFTLFLLALSELARRPRAFRWALVAGATGLLTVITTTNYAAIAPWALLFWLLVRGRPPFAEGVRLVALGGCGAILAVLVLMAASLAAGGSAAFYWPLIEVSMGVAQEPFVRPPLFEWLPLASHLVLPFLVAISGSLTLALRVRPSSWSRPEIRAFVAIFASYVGMLGTHALVHARVGHFLDEPHFAYVLLAPAALVLAGVIRCLPPPAYQGRRLPPYAYPLLAMLLVLPQVVLSPAGLAGADAWLSGLVRPWYVSGVQVASVLAGITVLAILASPVDRRWLAAAGLILGVAWSVVNPNRGLVDAPVACRYERDQFQVVIAASAWLSEHGIHAEPRSWFSLDEVVPRSDGCPDVRLGPVYLAIEQASMLWRESRPLPAHIADLSRAAMRNQIDARRRAFFVILSSSQAAPARDQELIDWASATQVFIRPRPVRRETFTSGPVSITVQVYGTGQRARTYSPAAPDDD